MGRSLTSAATYALAGAAQRILAFLLLPLYTATLSPAEFGRVTVLIAVSSGAYVVLSAGLDVSVMRRYVALEGHPQRQENFLNALWRVHLWGAPTVAATLGLLVIVAAPAGELFRADELALAVLGAAFLVSGTVIPLAALRAEQRLRPYVVLSVVQGAAVTTFTLLFVVGFDWGPAGWVGATLCAAAVSTVAALRAIPYRTGRRDPDGVREALGLGLPLVPHAAAQWSLQLANRLMLAGFVSADRVGIYGLGANIALPAMILIQSLNQGFMPTYARLQTQPEAAGELRRTITLQVAVVTWVGIAAALLGPALISVAMPASYAAAADLVPWLALGFVFMGYYFVPMNGVSLILGRTKFIWVLTISAAAVNLVAIGLLVGPAGLEGAAAASAIGYATQFVFIAIYARHVGVRMYVDVTRVCAVAVLGVACYLAAVSVIGADGTADLAVRTVASVAIGLVLARVCGLSVRRALRAVAGRRRR